MTQFDSTKAALPELYKSKTWSAELIVLLLLRKADLLFSIETNSGWGLSSRCTQEEETWRMGKARWHPIRICTRRKGLRLTFFVLVHIPFPRMCSTYYVGNKWVWQCPLFPAFTSHCFRPWRLIVPTADAWCHACMGTRKNTSSRHLLST